MRTIKTYSKGALFYNALTRINPLVPVTDYGNMVDSLFRVRATREMTDADRAKGSVGVRIIEPRPLSVRRWLK
jgi:hypothetical protein